MRIETQNIFFISDFHLSHKNILRFDSRPFADLDKMHEALIRNWNSVVSKDDTVFYLGDLSFGKMNYAKWFVHQLNGNINFTLGNHDKINQISQMNRFNVIDNEFEIYVKDDSVKGRSNGYQHIILKHYPLLSWKNMSHGTIHLHGHTHQTMAKNKDYDWFYKRKVIDVSCNGIDYTPISYSQVKSITDSRVLAFERDPLNDE